MGTLGSSAETLVGASRCGSGTRTWQQHRNSRQAGSTGRARYIFRGLRGLLVGFPAARIKLAFLVPGASEAGFGGELPRNKGEEAAKSWCVLRIGTTASFIILDLRLHGPVTRTGWSSADLACC